LGTSIVGRRTQHDAQGLDLVSINADWGEVSNSKCWIISSNSSGSNEESVALGTKAVAI
jgi:hypothetical protein